MMVDGRDEMEETATAESSRITSHCELSRHGNDQLTAITAGRCTACLILSHRTSPESEVRGWNHQPDPNKLLRSRSLWDSDYQTIETPFIKRKLSWRVFEVEFKSNVIRYGKISMFKKKLKRSFWISMIYRVVINVNEIKIWLTQIDTFCSTVQ